MRSFTNPPPSRIRHATKELGTCAQVEAFASLWSESWSKVPPIFGNCKMHMIIHEMEESKAVRDGFLSGCCYAWEEFDEA